MTDDMTLTDFDRTLQHWLVTGEVTTLQATYMVMHEYDAKPLRARNHVTDLLNLANGVKPLVFTEQKDPDAA